MKFGVGLIELGVTSNILDGETTDARYAPQPIGSGSPLCQDARIATGVACSSAGPGSDLSEELAAGVGPAALDSVVAPECPPGARRGGRGPSSEPRRAECNRSWSLRVPTNHSAVAVRSLSSISQAWSIVWNALWRMRNGRFHERICLPSPALYARMVATYAFR